MPTPIGIPGNAVNPTGGSSLPGSTYILPGLANAYQQLLGLNTSNYNNVLSAYGSGLGALAGGIPSIQAGYSSLLGNVQNTLGLGAALGGSNWGVAAPAAQAIADTEKQQVAAGNMQAVNSGFSSLMGENLANQAAGYAQRAYAGLGANLAQTAAGYQASLGGAGVQAGLTGLQLGTGLNQAAMGDLAGYRFANTLGGLTGNYGSYPYSGGGGGGGGIRGPTNNPSWDPTGTNAQDAALAAANAGRGGGGYGLGGGMFTQGSGTIPSYGGPGGNPYGPGWNQDASGNWGYSGEAPTGGYAQDPSATEQPGQGSGEAQAVLGSPLSDYASNGYGYGY